VRRLGWNWPAWLGFVLSLLAFASYFLVFARYPFTRDVAWVNFLLFGVSWAFLAKGLRRIFGVSRPTRGKIAGPILALLSLCIFGGFCFINFYLVKRIPASHAAPKVGQKAPEFVLRDTHQNLISLSKLLSTPLDPSATSIAAPNEVLLIFYRGYW
jgi:hypothetical protein